MLESWKIKWKLLFRVWGLGYFQAFSSTEPTRNVWSSIKLSATVVSKSPFLEEFQRLQVRSRRAAEDVAGISVAPIPRGLWLLRAFLDL